ncbi:methyl-accepting chemotaxis protein [Clostridium sp. YIM B02551]|uniref:methyl-accepting chemotaxis protein n=1 Tax=Clostridium sp. YIM B02551 TaxID=2910679 RepID=UPI001EEA1BA2|nr:HAMP domain-containing methyl-accepting chemotaxis protein [Clostridium sp. YIM B02551]
MNSIRKKFLSAFGIIVFLMFLLGIVSIFEINKINTNAQEMYHDQLKGISYIKDAQYYLSNVQRAEDNVLLAPTIDEKKEHSMHLEEYYSTGIIGNLNSFKEMALEDDRKNLDKLIDEINTVKKNQLIIIDKSMNFKTDEATSLSKDNVKNFQNIEKEIDSISTNKLNEAEQKYNDNMLIYNKIITIVIIFTISSLIFSIILALIISSSIVNPLRQSINFAKDLANGNLTTSLNLKVKNEIGVLIDALNNTRDKLKNITSNIKLSSNEVSLVSEQLSASMQSTNVTTTEIVEKMSNNNNNLQQIVSSVEQANVSLKNISASSKVVSSLAQNAESDAYAFRDYALIGRKSVDTTFAAISDIENSTKEVRFSIDELNILSVNIGEITSTITDIANQTNMLALNAAIESARAGEYGKGFSVVADEVKKLAEESASAANNIEKIVSDIIHKTNTVVKSISTTEVKVKEGTSVALDTKHQIELIINNMNLLTQKIQDISLQANKQAEQTNNISSNMVSIVDNTQKLSSTSQEINSDIEEQMTMIEEISSTSENLSSMTENLNSMVSYFKVK